MPSRKTSPPRETGPAYRNVSGWDILRGREAVVDAYGADYMDFLTRVKTEREAVRFIRELAQAQGGVLCLENRGKALALCRTGARPLGEGIRIVVAHLDSPRLDLKARPLYEDTEIALLKTHYYGGIKKYQWLARPLALHGVIAREDGSTVDIVIGEEKDEPCFAIDDLLPHLSGKAQYGKKLEEAFAGEKLNLVCATRPDLKAKEDKVKGALLALLRKKYGIVEQDFTSADIEAVPAGGAREVGFDRSLIGAYGHDDRACAWAAFRALADAGRLPWTTVVLLVDREETGSDGNTGAKSLFLEEALWTLGDRLKQQVSPGRALFRSRAISGDVNGAFDPDYPEVHEKNNAARLGYGVCITKFTGSRGKSGSSEASAEYMGWIRSILNRKRIPWQTGELGKVDEGGGGTVAKFLAEYGMDIVDAGPPLLSMHAPFELASKVDVYATYLAYRAFMEEP
jgi:aspartyl aminopeptidase